MLSMSEAVIKCSFNGRGAMAVLESLRYLRGAINVSVSLTSELLTRETSIVAAH